jgi:putative transposase
MDEPQRLQRALRRHAAISRLAVDRTPPGGRTALVAELACTHGVAPQTIWRWWARWRRAGERLEGLMPPERRRDAGTLRAFPAAALDEAVRLREEEPRRSTTTRIELLTRLHPEWQGQIHRSTLDRHLRRLGKTRRRLAHAGRVLRRFESAARNDLWIADFCLPALSFQEDGETHRAILFAVIDHCTRFVPVARFVPSRQALFVEEALQSGFARCGLPQVLFVDNGAELTGSLVQSGCTHLGIRLVRSHVGHPESRGAIERFFRTAQESFVPEMAAKAMIPTLPELNRFWDAWLEAFYHGRPHAALRVGDRERSPRQAWEEHPAPLRRLDPVHVEAAFLLRAPRRVDRTSLIHWEHRSYLCDDSLAGEKVEIRYHPAHPESVQLWRDGHFLQVAFRYLPPAHLPRQDAPPPRPLPQESLLDLLDRERQQRLRQAVAPPAGAPAPVFTEALAAALLEERLGRNLSEREQHWLAESWRRDGGWDAATTAAAIDTYLARCGRGSHVAYYLEFITQAHLRARKSVGLEGKRRV